MTTVIVCLDFKQRSLREGSDAPFYYYKLSWDFKKKICGYALKNDAQVAQNYVNDHLKNSLQFF